MPNNFPIRIPGLGLSTAVNAAQLKRKWETSMGQRNSNYSILVDGVFEGGGALGAAYAGALAAMQEQNIWFYRVAGASAGAITAALIAVGYTAQEIEWLCSSYFTDRDAETYRPASLDPRLFPKPINFLDFLDAPEDAHSFSKDVMRSTFLWHALNGTVIDNILNKKLKGFITKDKIVAQIKKDWPNLNNTGALDPRIALAPFKDIGVNLIKSSLEIIKFPEEEPRISSFVLFPSDDDRANFADTAWNFILDNNQPLRLITSLLYRGYIFKGDFFLSTMHRLLSAKKFPRTPDTKLRFSDLTIPLTVIASDTNSKTMKIYGSGIPECNNMEVAEVVRQSMSIPFVFQPRDNYRFMDGGMCSNYPYWLYSNAGRDYVVSNPGDDRRIKLGFILDDENAINPANFGCFPAKWHQQRAPYKPYEPDIVDVLKENFGEGRGQPNPIMDTAVEIEFSKYKILDIMDKQGKTMDKREWHLHDKIAPALMKDLRFYEIKIPVKGYHWLDFKVNSDKDDFTSIADRGYMSTMHTLIDKGVIPAPPGRDWKTSGPYH